MMPLVKYPRTRHLEGSGLQKGDEELDRVAFKELSGRPVVIEEKLDGANCAVSFDSHGMLQLQSRGHYLNGGPREAQFELLKAWAQRWSNELQELLGQRYVMFGEWLYAVHSLFYTDLPHYLMEFDVFDRATGEFLSTDRRRELLAGTHFIRSVPVLHQGPVHTPSEMAALIRGSFFIRSAHREVLRRRCSEYGQDPDRVAERLDPSGLMEGLYVKVEQDGAVKGRFKFVRTGFLQSVADSNSHWMERSILPNCLAEGVSLFQ